jgi:hypothetical protein
LSRCCIGVIGASDIADLVNTTPESFQAIRAKGDYFPAVTRGAIASLISTMKAVVDGKPLPVEDAVIPCS